MLRVVLVIDESGAKGYSKNQEKEPNELGVMVGYLIPVEALSQARSIAKEFFSHINAPDKLHLTSLTKAQQKEVREFIYKIFKNNSTCWFYEAVFVQGFYKSVHQEGRGGCGKDELLHSKLFSGVFVKAISRLRHERDKQLDILIITDPIDKKISKQFKLEVQDYVDAITRTPRKRPITTYNKTKNEVENWTIESTITTEDNSLFFDLIQYDIKCEDSGITFIADVLANSTLYYLRKKVREKPDIKLNSRQAIEDHPLSKQLYGTYDADKMDIGSFSDLVLGLSLYPRISRNCRVFQFSF